MPYCRSDLDVAALHGDNLTGKVQPYADALNIVYFFFPVKAFEDHALSALCDSLTAVCNVNFYIELPALNRNLNIAVRWSVLHSIIQDVEQGFTRPFPVMSQQDVQWAVHADMGCSNNVAFTIGRLAIGVFT